MLRATLVTPLSGKLARIGRKSATALTLWAEQAAELPAPWTGVDLEVLDAEPDPAAAMRAAAGTGPDVLFGPYGSSPRGGPRHRPGSVDLTGGKSKVGQEVRMETQDV